MSLLRARLPRDLHPVAWWIWALGLAVASSLTTNPLTLLVIVSVAVVVVVLRRPDHPWARAFRIYLWMGLAIVVVRVGFRLVFAGPEGGHVLLPLPEVPLPAWVAGVRLLGPVTRESLLAGLYDGMRLGAIIVCVGAANALANPKRLLRSLPPALYEIGTALVVAVTIVPQLADSVRRVRAAQRLRGGASGRVARFRRFLVPVLEDALERSLALAAGMDTRGYGRAPGESPAQRRLTGGLLLAGLAGITVGVYAVLDRTAPRFLATPMLVAGAALAVLGLGSAGRRVTRTRYRPDRWRWPEVATAVTGMVVGAAVWRLASTDVTLAHPGVDVAPTMTLGLLITLLVAVLPAVLTPLPAQPHRQVATREPVPELEDVAA
ncbi:MAG: energy-coupling factor transporter transmembrane component T [Nocardioidaceae bacterium]